MTISQQHRIAAIIARADALAANSAQHAINAAEITRRVNDRMMTARY